MEQAILEQLIKISSQMDEMRTEMKIGFENVDKRFEEQEAKFDAKLQALDEKFEARFKEQDEKIEARFKEQDEKYEAKFKEQGDKIDKLIVKVEQLDKKLDDNLSDISQMFLDVFATADKEHKEIIQRIN